MSTEDQGSTDADVGEGRSGLVFHAAHFPGRPPIDAYGGGGFRFSGASHRGALLCVPTGVYAWNVDLETLYAPTSMERILNEAAQIEVLLLGTGDNLVPIPADLRTLFREHGIMADPMATGPAVRTYNVLLSEGRPVAAGFLPVATA